MNIEYQYGNLEYMKTTVSSRSRSKTKMRMHIPRTYAAQEPQRNGHDLLVRDNITVPKYKIDVTFRIRSCGAH